MFVIIETDTEGDTVLDLLHAAREHRKTERRFLEKMFHFATAINRSRAQQLAQTEKPSEGQDENLSHVADGEQQHEAVGNRALVILQNFSLTYGETFVEVVITTIGLSQFTRCQIGTCNLVMGFLS